MDDTGTRWSITWPYIAWIASRQRGVVPPTTLGVFLVWNFSLPGSTRSGEKQRKKSSPTLSPDSCSFGRRISRVKPGNVVDSSTMSMSLCRWGLSASAAIMMKPLSGSLVLLSGVGTQMTTTSASPSTFGSVDASSLPDETSGPSTASEMSPM